jgi:uncharacterized membrane protein
MTYARGLFYFVRGKAIGANSGGILISLRVDRKEKMTRALLTNNSFLILFVFVRSYFQNGTLPSFNISFLTTPPILVFNAFTIIYAAYIPTKIKE